MEGELAPQSCPLTSICLSWSVMCVFLPPSAGITGVCYHTWHFLQILSFGGTSILIVVGVALETVQQLESQLMMRHYKGFLEK